MCETISSEVIAENIRKIRKINHLTQIQMADLLGYSERQIRRLETDGTFDIGVINLIALKLNISVEGILFKDVF